jgi:hypothetical protein
MSLPPEGRPPDPGADEELCRSFWRTGNCPNYRCYFKHVHGMRASLVCLIVTFLRSCADEEQMAREFLEKRSHSSSSRTDVPKSATGTQSVVEPPLHSDVTAAAATASKVKPTTGNPEVAAPVASSELLAGKEVCKRYLAGKCRKKQCPRDHPPIEPDVRTYFTSHEELCIC